MSGVIDKISIGKLTIWLILATTLISAGVGRWRNPHMRIAFLDAKLASRAQLDVNSPVHTGWRPVSQLGTP